MAEFKQLQTKNKKDDLWLLSDVSLGYVFMAKAKFNEQKQQDCYSAAFFVDEDTLDLIDETLGKDIKRKKCKTSEFEEKHKFPAPYPDEKNNFWVNFNNNAKDANGKPYELYYDVRPSVFKVDVDAEGKKSATEITLDANVGNGSKGNVVFSRFTNSYGSFLSMRKIYVTELVEYEGSGNYDPIADAMGIDSVETYTNEELAAKGVAQGKVSQEEQQAESDLAKSSPSAKKEAAPELPEELPEELPDVDEDFDSTIPF